jgi:CRISPR-associated protein Cas2
MRILLIYDIVNDRHRVKIVDACMDYGLDRVQYSAFMGQLGRNHQEELMLRIRAILGDGEGRIHLYPIDEKAWQRRLFIEQGMDNWEEEDDERPQSADE